MEIATALSERVLAPLVLGGELHPLPPIGRAHAKQVAESAMHLVRDELSTRMDVARARHARLLVAIDAIDNPGVAEWLAVVALNDLLQATSPKSEGLLATKPRRILLEVDEMLSEVAPVGTLREAISRHATFSRLLEITRTDTVVTWWCGGAGFRGTTPPKRLFLWHQLRRVSSRRSSPSLSEMHLGTRLLEASFLGCVARLLRVSPLTDLATASRPAPAFAWSSPTLDLLSTAPGRTLALRALRVSDPSGAMKTLRSAASPTDLSCSPQLGQAVASVLQELEAYASPSAVAQDGAAP